MTRRHIVILGNGITGATVARHLRKRGEDQITMVSGESPHPFSRPALMYLFMGDLRFQDTKLYEDDFWSKNRLNLRLGWVAKLDPVKKCLHFTKGDPLQYDQLVLATGSLPNRAGWPGQDLTGVQSLYSLQDVELLEQNARNAKQAVVVGGGLIGVELAEMLMSRGISVTFLVREKHFWGSVLPEQEGRLVARQIMRHGVELRLETELQEILPDQQGRARAVVTKRGEEIPCEIVGLTTGVHPNIELALAAGLECDRGILIDSAFRTSSPDILSGGDCVQHRQVAPGRRAVEPVWYAGKIHGEHIAANLCGEAVPYSPGIWFNSAKFFDIEYQTYGSVSAQRRDGEESFYWEHADGEKSIRIQFLSDTGAVLGVNVFGIRHRHAMWEEWIRSGAKVEEVVKHLGAANFDPEFFRQYEPEIVGEFNRQFPGKKVTLETRKGLSGFLSRLGWVKKAA